MEPTDYAAAVAAKIEHLILDKGYTVKSFADESGIPYTTLNRRLKSEGRSPFSVLELKVIADKLGVTAKDLSTVYYAASRLAA